MIDLRSDTVTQPSLEMREAMHQAPVGDDVYGEDPTVAKLEALAASMLNKQAAVFAPSGTQSNLIALMSHCQRGDEYLVGQDAHTFKYEGGGAAVLGSIQPQPLEFAEAGVIPLESLESRIKPIDPHFARSRLICLENTHAGQCLPTDYPTKVKQLADRHQLGMHLDGARLFNAAVAQQQSPKQLCEYFDSVSICLSKGLGAPVGSVLVGNSSIIEQARRWRKVLGGGMRQAGSLAAAGIFALEHNIERLADDHRRAQYLTQRLSELTSLEVLPHSAQTNMVFVRIAEPLRALLHRAAAEQAIRLPNSEIMRLVLHLDINDSQIEQVVELFNKVCG